MQIKDVMTMSPACGTPETPLSEIARLMVENDCGEIPIVADSQDNQPIGVVTDRDIVCRTVAKGINPLDLTAEDCMTQPVVTVTPQMSLEECCRVMEEKLIRRIPVVDEAGACVGIVALADIARETRKVTTGEIVKEISTPTAASSSAGI